MSYFIIISHFFYIALPLGTEASQMMELT